MIQIESSIQEAIQKRKPVVTLESSMITHGLPRPYSITLINDVIEAVYEEGAIPAFVAVIAGILRVGVTADVLKSIISDESCVKASPRDFPYLYTTKLNGSTTVAGTLFAAHQAGIEFLATGGIGGVHRGVVQSFDISADVRGLEKYPVCVFASGAKSVLDVPKTIEVIESQSIPVWGYRTGYFPEFFVRGTTPIVSRLETPKDIASTWRTMKKLGLGTASLVCIEVPEEAAIKEEEFYSWHEQAIFDSVELGIRGKEVTPYLLKRVAELSEGKSLRANLALLVNNARVAAQTAVAFSQL